MQKLHARELSRNQSILRFDVILQSLQHYWPIEQCLRHIRDFFGGKTKSPCFNLFIHWLIKQITNTYQNHFSRSYENCSISKLISKDVFKQHMSTGSGLLSFLSSIFAQSFGQIISIIQKGLRDTNLILPICFKMRKISLWVDVPRSKKTLLKLSYQGSKLIFCITNPSG